MNDRPKLTPHRIGLPPSAMRALYLERYPAIFENVEGLLVNYKVLVDKEKALVAIRAPKVAGFWNIPIHVGHDPNLGTFLRLYDDGKIERVTVREDEGDQIDLIKPADKDIQTKKELHNGTD